MLTPESTQLQLGGICESLWPKHVWKRRELVRDSALKSPHGAEPVRIRLALSVHLSANSYSIV